MTMRSQATQPNAADQVILNAAAAAHDIICGDDQKSSKLLVEQARAVGGYLYNQRLTTAQIRNVFGTVRSIESTWRTASQPDVSLEDKQRGSRTAMRELNLLKPRMAYAASRSAPVRPLAQVLEPAIDSVLENNDADQALERFGNFLDYFEAILAYHRAAGGK